MEALKASERLLVLGVGLCSTLGTGGGGGLDKSMGVLQDEFGVTPVQLSAVGLGGHESRLWWACRAGCY